MEPPDKGRMHRSRDSRCLTCQDEARRERLSEPSAGINSMDLSRYEKHTLTCVRALPRVRVTTSALAVQTMTEVYVGSFSW